MPGFSWTEDSERCEDLRATELRILAGVIMTIDDEILKELKWQSKLIEANFALLNDIKFEMINSRKQSEITYTIPIPEKKGIVQKLREKLTGVED